MKLLHCIIALVLFKNGYCYPLIFSKSGPINGKVLRSRTNRYYYSFTGIPFAKPLIGELRFKSPEPANPWKTTLDASQPTKVCLQPASKFNTALNFTEGDEDCLYLNVYTPTFVQKLPVMFWIHGGSFTFGQSGPAMYGSDFFMDKDIVLVTANYRLGIIGFISTEDDVIPGNFGLKDQVLALRWVKENIEQFGGDPNRVTIFGQSAGSVSTGYHFLSPLSKGLFHKAILESGAPLVPWSVSAPGIARQRAKKVANLVGCNSDISNDMLNV